ncbi:hypothetical protein DPMN_096095 [Dreissena polymorpha]|uniref:Uncharacterized protein n=1 Tax=Dreissena polymorpha TaxID=45954 RepID=A0A9D4L7Q1_DREPO|nr:hypothetical protein DPMN_096095 [Dreissena polymorpha]
MRTRYANLQNVDVDEEDDDHQLIPWAGIYKVVMQEVEEEGRGTMATAAAKCSSLLRIYMWLQRLFFFLIMLFIIVLIQLIF